MEASVREPADQDMDTVNPPRARSPRTLPEDHSEGSAGRRWMTSSWDCSSISAMPAVAPKLPSTCSAWPQSENRLGSDESTRRARSCRRASSPSRSRARAPTFQPYDQPHPPVPRRSSATAAAWRGRRLRRSDLVAGIQAPQVRQVPVLGLDLVPVVEPFLQLPVLADLVRGQAWARLRAPPGAARRRGRARRAASSNVREQPRG